MRMTPDQFKIDSPEATVFRVALKMIENPKHWTQKQFSKTTWFGRTKYCSIGAVRAAAFRVLGKDTQEAYRAIYRIEIQLSTCADYGIIGYNDSHAHTEVIALWRKVGTEQGWL